MLLILVKLIAIFILAMGILILVGPKKIMEAMFDYWEKGNRLYAAGVIRIVFGAIILSASCQSTVPWLLIVIGALIFLGGISIFAVGLERAKKIILWWKEKPVWVMRLLSISTIAFGGLLLWAA